MGVGQLGFGVAKSGCRAPYHWRKSGGFARLFLPCRFRMRLEKLLCGTGSLFAKIS
jgi:hypothetical protein